MMENALEVRVFYNKATHSVQKGLTVLIAVQCHPSLHPRHVLSRSHERRTTPMPWVQKLFHKYRLFSAYR